MRFTGSRVRGSEWERGAGERGTRWFTSAEVMMYATATRGCTASALSVVTLSIVPAGQVLPGTDPASLIAARMVQIWSARLKPLVQCLGAAFAPSVMLWYKHSELLFTFYSAAAGFRVSLQGCICRPSRTTVNVLAATRGYLCLPSPNRLFCNSDAGFAVPVLMS